MAEVRWIKIVTDIFDDEKILLIESFPEKDSIIVIWFKLLCLAGKHNNSGIFTLNDKIPYTDEMLSTIFRRPLNTVRMALSVFEQYGMIEIYDGIITIPNWGKHQTLDKLEAKKEYMRDYMAKYRQKQANKIACKTNSKTNSKANVSSAEEELDTYTEEKKEIYKERKDKDTAPNGADTKKQKADVGTVIGVEVQNKDTAILENNGSGCTQNIGVEVDSSLEQATALASGSKKSVVGEKESRAGAENKVSEANIIDYFATTWALYPKKVNKVQALKTYGYKLNGLNGSSAKEKANKIYGMLKMQIELWANEGEHGRDIEYIPHFATWLNANFEDANGKLRCR